MTRPTVPSIGGPVAALARKIEEAISLGTLQPGMWLKQVDLQHEYGCSRISLREALNRLVEKGLVSHMPNRGYRVEEIDEMRLFHLLRIRAVLEVEAIEEIVENADQADLAELRRLAAAFSETLLHGTVVEQKLANRAFHAALLKGCSNPELVWLIFDLRNRTPAVHNRRKNTHSLMLRAAEDHVEMVALLEARDVSALRTLMKQHVLRGMDAPERPAALSTASTPE
jgi:DNA-binding GntR family transcriptional regulator